jgi:hypothetical protein
VIPGSPRSTDTDVVAVRTRQDIAIETTLTVLVVVGLAVDAYVHLHLAPDFQGVRSSSLSEATLFRVEAVAAILAALALVLRPRRYTAAFAFLVAAAGTAAVVVYRYVDVGAFGPVPNMYDPFWAPTEKWVSAVAEGVAAVSALLLLVVLHARSRREALRAPLLRARA